MPDLDADERVDPEVRRAGSNAGFLHAGGAEVSATDPSVGTAPGEGTSIRISLPA